MLDTDAWLEANKRYLAAAVAGVRRRLEAYAAGRVASVDEREPAPPESSAGAPALETLCAGFGLTTFERDVLLMCAGPEIDGDFLRVCSGGDGDRVHPSFGLALAAFPHAHWSALTPASPLRRWHLVELSAAESLVTSPLRIDERVLHHLAGVEYVDDRLLGLVEPVLDPGEPTTYQREVAQRLARAWAEPGSAPAMLVGRRADERQAVAFLAAATLGGALFVLRAEHVPADVAEREELARRWEREAVLSGAALLVEYGGADAAEHAAAARFAETVAGPVVLSAREPVALASRRIVPIELRRPTLAEREALWRDALGPFGDELGEALEAVAGQFDLVSQLVTATGRELQYDAGDAAPEERGRRLWAACRRAGRPQLHGLAQRIDALATWDDLVLPERQLETLREIAVHVRRRARVYERWGFASASARGLGISAMFSGVSGTGKTMAAEVLANEIGLDLHRIDLSAVVSKYIGETEKNLRRVFDAAEAGGAILLFDEADALFGKRSEVHDSHDRYANIEVSYLLQRVEEYRGLAILTTNMRHGLDPAFTRRIRFIVEFAFPDAAQRADIWRRVFPQQTPVADIDIAALARLDVTGGNIRNVALNAAFLAADASEPVDMRHLTRAVRAEYAKLEKPLNETEVGAWQ